MPRKKEDAAPLSTPRRATLRQMPAATRRAVLDATNLLTATPAEAALLIACALTDPRDLLALAIAVPPRFANKCIAAPAPHRTTSDSAAAAAAQQAEVWSIIQEAARRWIASCTEQEQGWVPRRGRESWLGLMWEVESLRRRGAVFGRSHEDITLSAGGSVATNSTTDLTGYCRPTTASKVVMRAGRHYAQFTAMSVRRYGQVYAFANRFGVIRPGWDVEGGKSAWNVDGHCFYYTGSGSCCPGHHDWEGRQGAVEDGNRIGMLLDLDQGSMTVYKNDERLGVMATGLSGEYSWAAALWLQGESARIEAAAAPASPTVEEVKQAEAWTAPVA
eukprot:COSAG06_NODE_1811_length_8317_cov_7.969944_5_plen_332_part_00